MATAVVVPQAGLEVDEGTVISIYVEVGDRVAGEDPLVEIETDKAIADVVAPHAGTVTEIHCAVDQVVPVGDTLVTIEADGAVEQVDHPPRLRAAPVARRAAAKLGVALEDVTGTGPRGRIKLRDVEAHAAVAAPPPPELEPLSATRRAVARRMVHSAAIPQFALEREIDATWLLEEKRALARQIPGLGVTDLIVRAHAEMLTRHPDLAAAWEEHDGEPALRRPEQIHIGLAIATDRGLLVGVIKNAATRPLHELVEERKRLTETARAGRLTAEDMTGATSTLSNLGSFGVDRFAAMLNPGETTILATGRTVDRVVPRGLQVAPMMTLTLTVDHRVADGATGAVGLTDVADLLEGRLRAAP